MFELESQLTFYSLMRSDVLPESTFQFDLRYPALRLQRLYTTRNQGLSGFFEYLKRALTDYNRRLIIVKTDDRFSAGILIRGKVEWDDEAVVNENVAVLAFTPTASQAMSSCECSRFRIVCDIFTNSVPLLTTV